ncbi:MAG: hypothetical protein EOR30_33085, partial [Mesorhizobium sp.]
MPTVYRRCARVRPIIPSEITRIGEEDGRVTVDLGPLVTVDVDKVRLLEKYRPPKRKKPLRDMVD